MGINLALRFLLELCAFAALGYWGFQVGPGRVSRILLAVGLPTVAAVAWGAFVSPRATVTVSPPVRLAVELVIFGLAVAALLHQDHQILGLALGATYVTNRLLLHILDQ